MMRIKQIWKKRQLVKRLKSALNDSSFEELLHTLDNTGYRIVHEDGVNWVTFTVEGIPIVTMTETELASQLTDIIEEISKRKNVKSQKKSVDETGILPI